MQIFYLLNCRSLTESLFSIGVLSNRWILYGIAAMAALQLAFTYAPPTNTLFHTAAIGVDAWLLILAVGVLTYGLVELEKYVRNIVGRPVAHQAHELAGVEASAD